jgi:hypothetical protein
MRVQQYALYLLRQALQQPLGDAGHLVQIVQMCGDVDE